MVTFSENDIRPSDYQKGMEEALVKDLQWLHSHKKTFVNVRCPACDSSDTDPEFKKYGFVFVCCRKCKTVFMNPRANAKTLAKFYSKSILYDYWNKYVFPASKEIRREKIFRPRVEGLIKFCKRFHLPMNCLVDVGAAGGLLCLEAVASREFRRVVALEPSSVQAENCRNLGIETVEATVENAHDLIGIASIITCFEVIEHVFSPSKFIQQCKNILAPKGIIAVTCPNYHGFDILTLGTLSSSIDAEHINLFNPRSLSLLFERNGFDVLECKTPGQLDAELVHKTVLSGLINLENQPFLRFLMEERWEDIHAPFQDFLRTNMLSSHLWLVARAIT